MSLNNIRWPFAAESPYFILLIVALIILTVAFFILCFFLIKNSSAHRRNVEIHGNNLYMLQALIDASLNLIFLKDENLRYVFVNKAFEEFHNLKTKDLIGKTDFQISEKEFADYSRKSDLEVLRKQGRFIDKINRNNRVYEIIKFPVLLEKGKYGVGAIIKDITSDDDNRKIIEKSAHRGEMLYEVFSRDTLKDGEEYDFILSTAIKLTASKCGIVFYKNASGRYDYHSSGFGSDYKYKEKICARFIKHFSQKTGNEYLKPNIFENLPPYLKGDACGDFTHNRMISVPFISGEKIRVLLVLFNKSDKYNEDDIHQLTILINGLWQCMEKEEAKRALSALSRELRSNETWLESILNSTAEGIIGINLNKVCIFCNKSGVDILGYESAGELIGKKIVDIVHLDGAFGAADCSSVCPLCLTIEKGEGVHRDSGYLRRKDKTPFAAEIRSYPQYFDGKIVGAVMTFNDITERKKAEEKIIHLGYNDPLTGLYNRRFFETELKRLDVKRNLPISIIMGDINGLKLTNDVFGHAAGDEILIQTAAIFRGVCRADDIIARWGGDEFIVILPGTAREDALKVEKRINDAFFNVQSNFLKYSISLGTGTKTDTAEKIGDIINRADELMYLDKTSNIKSVDYDNIGIIIKNLFKRDPRIKEHAENVMFYCEKMARRLRFSKAQISLLKDVAYYHDIGKIALSGTDRYAIPDYRKHPTVGYRILNGSVKTMEAANYVLSHHERWDGTGYPKGLKGEAIPLLSRIVAIAEHYDNLRRNKEYMLSKEKALEILNSKSGSFFDPDIVAVFTEILAGEDVNTGT